MGRGERKHLLFPSAGYGNWDLIMASSRRWLRMRREMKGRHMGGTTVVLKEQREKLPVGILLVLTIMSSSGAKPPLKLLTLGKCVFFLFPQSLSLTSSPWTDGGGIRGLSELRVIKEIMHGLRSRRT